MHINPIGIGGYTDPTAAGYAVESTTEKSTSTVEKLLEKLQSPSTETEVLRDIATDYDVTSIQPQEFSEMLGRLYESGILSEEEYQMLGQIRVELDEAGYEVDEPVNLIEFCQKKIDEITNKEDSTEKNIKNQVKNTQQQLAWLEKMAIIQEDPEAIGLNALV